MRLKVCMVVVFDGPTVTLVVGNSACKQSPKLVVSCDAYKVPEVGDREGKHEEREGRGGRKRGGWGGSDGVGRMPRWWMAAVRVIPVEGWRQKSGGSLEKKVGGKRKTARGHSCK